MSTDNTPTVAAVPAEPPKLSRHARFSRDQIIDAMVEAEVSNGAFQTVLLKMDEMDRAAPPAVAAVPAERVAPIVAARYRNGTGRWTYTDTAIGSIEADGWNQVEYLCNADAAAPQATPPDHVRMPTSEAEAELMAKLGYHWLRVHAPHKLAKPEAPPAAPAPAPQPLTRQQIDDVMTKHYPLDSLLRENVDAFEACVRDIEATLGITGGATGGSK